MPEIKPLKLKDLGGGAGRIEEFAAGDTLPKAALPALGPSDVGAATAAQGALATTAVQPADLTAGTAVDTATSGDTSARRLTVTVSPASASTRQVHAQSVTIKYQSSANLNPQGWIVSLRLENQLIGSAQVDKSVVAAAYTTGIGGGRIDKALGFEAVVAGLDGATSINQYAGFYSPNMIGTPGIGNITAAYSFANDWSAAAIKNVGQYLKALDRVGGGRLREVAASPHPGYVAGRYYGAPVAYNPAPQALIAQFGYPVLFQVHERTTFSKIGCRITTAGAAGTTLRLGIFYAEGGMPSALIYDSGALSAAATGDVEKAAVGVTLEAGMYVLMVASTGTPSLQAVTTFDTRAAWGRTTSSGEETTPLFAVGAGAFPAGFATASGYFAAASSSIDIWMRK